MKRDAQTDLHSDLNFSQSGYVVIRNLLTGSALSFLNDYAVKSAEHGRMGPGDLDVPGTPCAYSDPFMESLMEALTPRIEAVSCLELYPTYTYFRVYKHGDLLARHKDRPSCEVSVTLSLGYRGVEPWPIWIESGGASKSIVLERGDAMVYKGTEIPHWRERFTGEQAAQAFLHYVDQAGPYREWIYDKREALGTSPIAKRIIDQFRPCLGLTARDDRAPKSA